MKKIPVIIAFTIIFGLTALAQSPNKPPKRILLDKETNAGTAKGTLVKKDSYHHYVVRIKKGQKFYVDMLPKNESVLITIISPEGSEEEPFLQTNGGNHNLEAEETGDYLFQVMKMSGRKPLNYTLTVTLSRR
jgi:hypothetical protein